MVLRVAGPGLRPRALVPLAAPVRGRRGGGLRPDGIQGREAVAAVVVGVMIAEVEGLGVVPGLTLQRGLVSGQVRVCADLGSWSVFRFWREKANGEIRVCRCYSLLIHRYACFDRS